MYLTVGDIEANLDLQASTAENSIIVVCASFRKTLKTAGKICKYLEEKGYKQAGPVSNSNKQGALYQDDDKRKFVVSIVFSNEVHVYPL